MVPLLKAAVGTWAISQESLWGAWPASRARRIQKGQRRKLLSILGISARDESGVRFGGGRVVRCPDM